jgi:hypothetical protein
MLGSRPNLRMIPSSLPSGYSTLPLARVAIRAVYYNFARIRKTLRITPAMAVGLSDHVWSPEEIVLMADSYMPRPGKRDLYEKRM